MFISLSEISKLKVVDVIGYVSDEFDQYDFVITKIILENGKKLNVGGEHDYPFIDDGIPNVTEEDLERLHKND